jgi:hypothetical protein
MATNWLRRVARWWTTATPRRPVALHVETLADRIVPASAWFQWLSGKLRRLRAGNLPFGYCRHGDRFVQPGLFLMHAAGGRPAELAGSFGPRSAFAPFVG